MKPAKCVMFLSSIAYTIVAIQISCKPAPADTKPPAVGKADAPASQPTTQAVIVKIDNFKFEPKELQITAGTTVTWQNADDVPHTATSKDDPQLFDSGALDTDEKFSFTFTKPGKFTYYCKVHPHMTGVVTVK